MHGITKNQHSNFRLSNLCLQSVIHPATPSYQSSTTNYLSTPSGIISPGLDKQNVLNRMLTKMYEQFHYIDQVTFKKTNAKNLLLKKKAKQKVNNIIWINSDIRNKNYSKSCQNILQSQNAQDHGQRVIVDERDDPGHPYMCTNRPIGQVKKIKQIRYHELLSNWKQKNTKKEIVRLEINRQKNSQYRQLVKQSKVRLNVEENMLKQGKFLDDIKRRLYEINVEQFRRYYEKKQKFCINNRLSQLSPNINRHSEGSVSLKLKQWQKSKQQQKKINIKLNGIKKKQDNQIQLQINNQARQFEKLIKMRIRHETQFNWQKNIK